MANIKLGNRLSVDPKTGISTYAILLTSNEGTPNATTTTIGSIQSADGQTYSNLSLNTNDAATITPEVLTQLKSLLGVPDKQFYYTYGGQKYNAPGTGYAGEIDPTTGNFVTNIDATKQKSDQLFADINKGYEDMLKMQSTFGQQRLQDLKQGYANLAGAGQQDLINRGLTGSTILPAMKSSVERQKQNAYNSLYEAQNQQRLNILGDKYKWLSTWNNPSLIYSSLLNAGNA